MSMDESIKPTTIVDARGSYCPGPLMLLIKAYKEAKTGDVISVYSTDNGTKRDAPAWIKKSGNELIGVFDRDGYAEIIMKKIR